MGLTADKEHLRYNTTHKTPYNNIVFDGRNYYILPEQVNERFFGLRKLEVKNHIVYAKGKLYARKVITYHGKRIPLSKLSAYAKKSNKVKTVKIY